MSTPGAEFLEECNALLSEHSAYGIIEVMRLGSGSVMDIYTMGMSAGFVFIHELMEKYDTEAAQLFIQYALDKGAKMADDLTNGGE